MTGAPTTTGDEAVTGDEGTTTEDNTTDTVTGSTTDDAGDYVPVPCPTFNTVLGPGDDLRVMGIDTQDELDMLAGCTDLHISLSLRGELDLTPLSELRHIVGGLSIYGDSCQAGQDKGLASLKGLENLRTARGLRLDCLRIADVAPLARLTTLARDLRISSLHGISSLEGLHNLKTVGEGLLVDDCDQLGDLGGLRGLEAVGVWVSFGDLPITDLKGLDSLVKIGGPDSESRLSLSSLPALTSLDGLVLEWQPEQDISIYSTGLTDLTALAGVDELTALALAGNSALTSLAGLEDLAVVHGELRLGSNPGLTDLAALGALESVGGLTLDTTAFADLGPLPALVEPGDVRLSDNEQLTSLSALAGSTSLRSLIVERNAQLAGLPELVGLVTVDGALELRDNPVLTDLSDLPAVTTVGGRLAVVYHSELLQTDAEAWAAPIESAERKVVGNKGYDAPLLDPCPWADDWECDHGVCETLSDGADCLSD